MDWEELYKRLSIINLLLILTIASFLNLFAKPSLTSSFLIGALIMIANLHLMQKGIRSHFKGSMFTGNQAAIVFNFYLRLAIIGIIIYILLKIGLSPIGILIGLSVVSLGILIFAILLKVRHER